jgi:hypothetical protein
MSNLPLPKPPQSAHEAESSVDTAQPPVSSRFERWHRRVLSICLVTFALEVGLFLVIYPWTRGWSLNFIPVRVNELVDIWMSYSLRAAVSALGLIDMWIAGTEFWRLLKPKSE